MSKPIDVEAIETDDQIQHIGGASRRLALEALERIDTGGAYANLLLPEMLGRSNLSPEDRRFVTQLVYGTTRMRRACDYLVDRFVVGPTDSHVRAALRLGAFQLHYLHTPPHAAVNATVAATTGPGRSVVNAVLRRVSESEAVFPSPAIEMSYPDWLVERFIQDLGHDDAMAALSAMNEPATTSERADGYVQDPASQAVAGLVGAVEGELVIDLCAAPGGKATGMASEGASVIAVDRRLSRGRLVQSNAERLDLRLPVLVTDGRSPSLRPGCADRVLVDAPCSGFGSFRRRADARWRIEPEAPERLAELQVELVLAGLDLLRSGGELLYSVCTLTTTETVGVLDQIRSRRDDVELVEIDAPQEWRRLTSGVVYLLPDTSDGMMAFKLRRH